ncbi:YraN family protein [Haliovirga abyssi]|uniref:UPF0102 protein HLVA_16570 n=1 Tax=Haliovirga abyssi TaxID=2996794 RepID=A0AAU9DRA8_9FUSO|nr:YraN family protein [Haliovirga abyssi]BDU51088.1 UPF0102 protein [Haliovirga abyssi]
MNKRRVGSNKEEEAIKIFKENGYEILEKNFRGKRGEIDFIAKKNNTIIFIEVKYRSNKNYGYGEESVNKRKQDRIYRTAQEYIQKNELEKFDFRFDVVAINKNEYNWIMDSFWG